MGDGSLSQDEIDALLSMGDEAPPAGGSSGGDVDLSSLLGGESAGGDNLGADALSQLANALGPTPTPTAAPATRATGAATRTADNMSLLMDVRVRFTAELGRTNMYIKDVLLLGEGSIVELDKVVGDEVDIIVNDSPFGRGRLVVIDEFLGVQITHIYDPMARLRGLI
ncbi:MAG: flagellar motor switch protein FliN [Spirochaetales bacterium]|nr:flagellar motor switch protein FliN [Spirochaetales bacterium]